MGALDVEGLMEGHQMLTRPETWLRILLITIAIMILASYCVSDPPTAYVPEPDVRISPAPEPQQNG